MSFMLLGILNSQASGGGGPAYELLETTTLTSDTASVTFTGLGAYSDYKHLQIRMVARAASGNAGYRALRAIVNGITSASYSEHYLEGKNSTVASGNNASASYAFSYTRVPDPIAPAGVYSAHVLDVLDFQSTSKSKTLRMFSGSNGNVGESRTVQLASAVLHNTSAVSSIQLLLNSGSLASGSRFSLIGVK